jgi:uncharacterized membrane protein YeaQ/YmgE (transglycosylase-associated protein family)
MSWIAYIIVGLIAGALAKYVMPGTEREPAGWLGTMILGIAGAVLGGWLCNLLLGAQGGTGINLWSILVSFLGSVLILWLMRVLNRPRAA